jgi:tripartite-type tricarboxylate transporter receptor subunit TctC
MIHVPYKGNAPAMSDLVADQVPAMFTNMSDALPQAAAGSIRLLAITSADRMAQVPNVPTAIESGYPNFKILTWNGLLAPAGTPREIKSKIAAEVARIAKDPQVVGRLASYGDVAVGDSPEHFASTIAADISLWKQAVEIAGVSEKDAGR